LIKTELNSLEPISNDLGIIVFRVTNTTELEQRQAQLSEIQRIDDYMYFENKVPEAPFGIYILFGTEENKSPVGIMSIIKTNSTAETMTDIIKSHQGKGLGTKLRQVVLSEVSAQSKSTQYIQSLNEWDWGNNFESVKSALKCGFGIYSMFEFGGALHMFYPVNSSPTDEIWPKPRMDAFLALSNIIRNPNEFDWNSLAVKQQLTDHFKTILLSLNLSLLVDQQTFLVFCSRISNQLNEDSFDWEAMFSSVLQSYIQDITLPRFQETSIRQTVAQHLKILDKTIKVQNILRSQIPVADKIKRLSSLLYEPPPKATERYKSINAENA
jgi:GNAT superfamily N-acetyltransferase